MVLKKKQLNKIKSLRSKPKKTLRITSSSLERILYKQFKVLDSGFIRVMDYMGDDPDQVAEDIASHRAKRAQAYDKASASKKPQTIDSPPHADPRLRAHKREADPQHLSPFERAKRARQEHELEQGRFAFIKGGAPMFLTREVFR